METINTEPTKTKAVPINVNYAYPYYLPSNFGKIDEKRYMEILAQNNIKREDSDFDFYTRLTNSHPQLIELIKKYINTSTN